MDMSIGGSQRQRMAEKLQSDITMLMEIAFNVPECSCYLNSTKEALSKDCPVDGSCEVKIGQAFHNIGYATIAAFKHELDALKLLTTSLTCSHQMARQDALSAEIDDVICQYAASKNCQQAMFGLSKLARKILDYSDSVDLTLSHYLSSMEATCTPTFELRRTELSQIS